MIRFDNNISTQEEAISYFKNRACQLLKSSIFLNRIITYPKAVVGIFSYRNNLFQSIYILKPFRNQGLYKEISDMNKMPILTTKECEIESYLEKNDYQFLTFKIEEFEEYKIVQNFYGDQKANRSNVYLMNHIDEGLAILTWINASNEAKKAYCLHPLLQSDEALGKMNIDLSKISSNVLINAMEYRSVANEYLSERVIESKNGIRLSPLNDVNQMLIADKIQNRKDFELYHLGKHERSDILIEYFNNWLQRLDIREDVYQDFKAKLII